MIKATNLETLLQLTSAIINTPIGNKSQKKKKIIRLNNQLVRTVNIQIAQTEMPLVNQNHVESFTTLQKALNIFFTLNRIYNGLTKKSIIKL